MCSPVFPYDVRDLWIPRPDGRIFGQLYVPKGTGAPLPAVICSHFFGGSHRTSGKWAAVLARTGLVTYAFDFCGATHSSKSEGPGPLDMSVLTEAEDLDNILDGIRALPETDADRTYLLGQSQGGAVSAMVADKRPHDVAGLFLIYPAFSIHNQMIGRFGTPQNVPNRFSQWQPLGQPYAVDAMAYDPYDHMSYPGPVYIWHGDQDDLVPITYSERAASSYPNAQLEVIPKAGHGFHDAVPERIAQQIAYAINNNSN